MHNDWLRRYAIRICTPNDQSRLEAPRRAGQEPVVVNLDIVGVERPEEVAWVDDIHKQA